MKRLKNSARARHGRLGILLAVAAGASAATYGCSPSPPTPAKDAGVTNAAKDALLKAVGECTLTLYGDFHAATGELTLATEALSKAPTDQNRAAAQEAWKKAIDIWQQAELFQFGPAATSTSFGGQNLRDPIYSWPLVSRCLVEQQIVSKSYLTPGLDAALINTRGLAAAEYLLFYTKADNGCATTVEINTSGSWASLSADELTARKVAYAHAVAVDLAAQTQALVDAWAPDKKNFFDKLASAGRGNNVYASDQVALNAISDAMFYLDSETKDMKLGTPAGILECTTPTCPEAIESLFAGRSKQHIRNNLLGFRRLFQGCGADGAGAGFDDLLESLGVGELAVEMRDHLAAAIAALDAIEEPTLEQALVDDLPSVIAAHTALKLVTTDLKAQFVGVLDLEVPKRVEGDND